MIERGREWPISPTFDTFSPSLPPDKRSFWLRTKTAMPVNLGFEFDIEKYIGVLDYTEEQNIAIYAGAGFGGGSLVYGGMTVQPDASLFAQAFPSDVSYSELASTYYPRVIQMLNAQVIPQDLLNTDYFTAARLALDHAAATGIGTMMVPQAYDWNILRGERDGQYPLSTLHGDLLYGNNTGSKNSLDKNYLAQARATGLLKVELQHVVQEIGRDADGYYYLTANQIDTVGNTVGQKTFHCKRLFVCAGTQNTTKLMVKAKAKGTLPNLNEFVGKNWGNNGNGMFRRVGLTETTGTWQANPPIIALLDFASNGVAPVLAEQAPLPLGSDCNCLMHLGCVLVPERGEFVFDGTEAKLQWAANGNDTAVNAITDLVNRLNAQTGGSLDNQLIRGVTRHFTYHPLGGMSMGLATDFYGRVKGYDKLYVIDGAFMPGTAACSNPSLTISALAERSMDKLLVEDFGV